MGSSSKKDVAQQQLENKVALIMIAAILGLAIVYLIWAFVSKRSQRSNQSPQQQEQQQQLEEQQIQQHRNSSRMRNIRPDAAVANANHDGINANSTNRNDNEILNEENREEEAEGDDIGDENDTENNAQGAQNIFANASSGQGIKMTKKQMIKMQKKREKQQEKEAREAYLAHRREIETRRLDEEREEKERKAAEKEEEDERRKLIEKERAQKAQQELDLWKDYIEVAEAGINNNTLEVDEATKTREFVNFVIENRVVTFESLASSFDLSIQEVVNKLKDLEREKMIQGIFTDRGKYIYLTTEDLENVANYIKRKGKVTIPELVNECVGMINLSPKPVATKLMDENS